MPMGGVLPCLMAGIWFLYVIVLLGINLRINELKKSIWK